MMSLSPKASLQILGLIRKTVAKDVVVEKASIDEVYVDLTPMVVRQQQPSPPGPFPFPFPLPSPAARPAENQRRMRPQPFSAAVRSLALPSAFSCCHFCHLPFHLLIPLLGTVVRTGRRMRSCGAAVQREVGARRRRGRRAAPSLRGAQSSRAPRGCRPPTGSTAGLR